MVEINVQGPWVSSTLNLLPVSQAGGVYYYKEVRMKRPKNHGLYKKFQEENDG